MSDEPQAKPPKKKGKLVKIIVMIVGLLVLIGGGAGAGLYAAKSGLIGGKPAGADDGRPKLVPKSEQKRGAPADAAGGHADSEPATVNHGMKTPAGQGGEKYASTYYPMDKEFTVNLRDSSHFIQVGVAVSTPYDNTVIENLKTDDIAVRSAILMALGDTTEDDVFTTDGKRRLQVRLARAINDTLKQKEGFGGVSNVYFTNFVVQ